MAADSFGAITVNGIGLPGIYTEARAYDANGLLAYHGWAYPGTGQDLPKWCIAKYTYDASSNVTKIEWAQGAISFSNIWTNRGSVAYS